MTRGCRGPQVQMETPVEEIIAHFATRGVDYDEMHAACYLAARHRRPPARHARPHART